MKLQNLFAFGIAFTMLLASCGGKEKPKTNPTTDTNKVDTTAVVDTTVKVPTVVNIVETAKADTGLSMLVELLTTADLVTTLSDENAKFTVFAPSNDAFRKLGDKKLASLKEEKNKEMLKDLLTYHVVSGELMAASLKEMTELDALAEKVIKVTVKAENVMVGGATVTNADIKASNGLVHKIDGVMTPPAKKSKAKVTTTTKEVTNTEVKTNNVNVNKTTVVTETKTKGK